jgi:uncharacterized protein Yka (UPF0111/DUF47 family)
MNGDKGRPVMTNVFEQQLNEVREDVREVRSGIGKIAEAITKLAVLEERHQTTTVRVDSLDKRVTAVESKASEVEKAHLKLLHTMGGAGSTLKVMWMVVGAVITGLAVKFLPLLGAHP